jgi:hypothetical protein
MSGYKSTLQNLSWCKPRVVYEIYVHSFKDTMGNGISDLQGIIDKLDYLNNGMSNMSLRVDAIWLNPFNLSPIFMGVWNDFLWSLVILNSKHKKTLTIGLAYLRGQHAID